MVRQEQEQEQQQQQQHAASRALLLAVLLNMANKVGRRRLTARGARISNSTWPGNFTALHAAAVSNCWHALPALLGTAAEQGISVDSRLEFQLHSRVYLEFLAELGFAYNSGLEASEEELERLDKDGGVTPLLLACWEGSLDVIPILLANGASAALTSDMTSLFQHNSPTARGDALAHLLYGKLGKDAARLEQTVKLLVVHGANPLAVVKGLGSSCGCSYISDKGLPAYIRRCIVSLVKKHGKGLLEKAGVRLNRAALNGDGAALLYTLRQISLVDVLEAAPPEMADLVIRELPERMLQEAWEMLQRAVIGLQPKALRALLAVNKPRTFEGMVVHITYRCRVTFSWGSEPLGLCPVLLLIERLTRVTSFRAGNGFRAPSSYWQARAAAVMAHLIEAGFKPSIYPEAEVGYDYLFNRSIIRNYDALADHPELLQNVPRMVLTALQQPAWSQAKHRDFPPAFRAAVRAFLLAASASARRRQQQQQDTQEQQGPDGPAVACTVQQAVCDLGDLPAPLLDRVLGLAAYPLSAWL